MRFLLTCAGTAGHINPAIAVADRLKMLMPDAAFLFVGSGRTLENRLIPAAGYEIENITISGFSRGFSPKKIGENLKTLRNLAVSARQCRRIIQSFKPDVVIGTGGYVCYPVLKAASGQKIPTVLHESNAVPGLTTKMLSSIADRIMVAFPEVSQYYRHPERVVVTGTPVRGGFCMLSKDEARRKLGITDPRPIVVSFWGSLGASAMNEMMADFIQLNCASGAFCHIHATGGGEDGLLAMQERLRLRNIVELPAFEDLRAYIDDMDTVMAAADLVLCRAGASTMAELTAMGMPAILVPSPNVTNNHQEKNARQLGSAGGAVVLLESECSGRKLYDTAAGLIREPEKLEKMSAAQKKMGVPDACGKITDVILSLMNEI